MKGTSGTGATSRSAGEVRQKKAMNMMEKAKKEAAERVDGGVDSVDDEFFNGFEDEKKKRVGGSSSSGGIKKGMTSSTTSCGGGGGDSGNGGGSMRICQAERCTADLTDAKQYHRRHKVCEHHAKAQVVMVAGIRQRFCQQCSRFHEISEFDEAKRSCRRRLAGHNERRRKITADPYPEAAGSSRKSAGTGVGPQLKDIVCGQVDDRERIQITTIQENAAYKHFQIR